MIKFTNFFYNLTGGFAAGIAIYPFIFLRTKLQEMRDSTNSSERYKYDRIVNHERIHIEQQKELLVIFYPFFYYGEYIIRRIQKDDFQEAYHAISFEKEAYENQDNFDYLKTRKRFAWRKY